MTPPLLRAVSPTPFVTLQDGGRRGWRRFGVTGSGVMDRSAQALANALVGNRATEPTLEFAYAGGEWRVEAQSCRIAVTGCTSDVTVDGVAMRPFESFVLEYGQTLRIGGDGKRVWGYIGVAGGFDAPLSFGSRATHSGTGIGGWTGGPLHAGEALPLRANGAPNEPDRSITPLPEDEGPFHVILGPQSDFLDEESISRFLSEPYQMTWQQDRMAYRLEGPALHHTKGFNIVSDGVLPGCIQIMGTGQPLVLMRDAGTNGGYPKLGGIIDADLDRFAQTRPGEWVRFEAIGVEEAQTLRRRYQARLQTMTNQLGTLPA
jgi:biotin-dependent carboxylase-like uncharacterized protein